MQAVATFILQSKECSIFLSCCEKAFVNLSRMRVPILEFERDLCPEPWDNGVIRLGVPLSHLISKMLQETLILISHSAIGSKH